MTDADTAQIPSTNTAPPGGCRELLRVAWPLILSTASYSVMHFLDRVMLTRYSEVTAAAATCGGMLSFALLSGFLGIAGYTNTFIAQYHGAGDKQMCTRSLWQGIYFALAGGLLYPVLLRPLGLNMLDWVGHEAAVLEAERVYFGTLAFGAVFPLVGNAISSFFSGRGDTKTIMWISLSTACVNIALNYCLIFGHFGMPEMGIKGAAIATICASGAGTAAYFALVSRKRWRDEYGVWRFAAFRRTTFLRLIRFGGPSGLSFCLDILAFSLFILFIGNLGRTQLIASNIAVSISSLSFLPMLGLCIATTILVGRHIGEGRKWAAEKSAYSGVKCAACYTLFMGALFVIFPRQFFWMFKGDGIADGMFEEVFHYGRRLLIMVAALGLFDAMNVTFSGALKGAGDTWFTMCVSVLFAWVVFVPPVYLVTTVWKASVYYAWMWFVVYVSLLAIVYWWRFRKGRWKLIEIRELPTPTVLSEATGEARILEN